MKKQELLRRIEALEQRVRELEARPPAVVAPAIQPPGVPVIYPGTPSRFPDYFDPFNPYKITCGVAQADPTVQSSPTLC